MNYPFTNAVLDYLAKEKIDTETFVHRINKVLHSYPEHVNEVTFNLLGSHDTPRILTICGENKKLLKLMFLFQLSFTGSPCLYYGDEIGMTGDRDPGCRECMRWDEKKQNRELFAFVQRLIQLRKTSPAFGNGAQLRFLEDGYKENILIYEKKQGEETLLFIMNPDKKEKSLSVSYDSPSSTALDLWTNQEIILTSTGIEVSLDSYDFKVIKIS